MTLDGRKIALVVTGGIAAYKAVDLTSRLRKAGAEVRVAMTRGATQFVAPLSFEAISGHPVYSQLFDQPDSHRMEHIEWARWADAVVVAPATADFMAKMAHGLADDAPLTLLLAFNGPVWIAPAMNTVMWNHPATQANLKVLEERGVKMIQPGSGLLACGEIGEGRMAEPEDIIAALMKADSTQGNKSSEESSTSSPLKGQKVLITAGPTRESLDPIRFISNRSTGKMGVALAESAARLGAYVILVHGPLSVPIPADVESVPTESSEAMLKAVQERFAECSVAIFSAAVANYRPAQLHDQKFKGEQNVTLELIRNPDIAGWAGSNRNGNQTLVGFTAESQNLIPTARRKLADKKLDLIFANLIGVEGVGFVSDTNEVTLIDTEGSEIPSGRMAKSRVADWMWAQIIPRLAR